MMRRRRFFKVILAFLTVSSKPINIRRNPFGRPPTDLRSERATVGSLLMCPEYLPKVERIVTGWMFRGPEHKAIFDWLVEQRRSGLPYDLAALSAHALSSPGSLFAAGFAKHQEFMDDVPCPDHVEGYAQM